MFKFLKRLKSYWWLVILIIVLTCVQVVFDFLLPTLMGEIIKMIQSSGIGVDMNAVVLTAVEMILVALGSGVMGVSTCILASKVTAKMMARVRYELYSKVSEFSEHEMNKYSVSSLITRTTNDITNVSNTYVLLFRFMLYGPLLAIGAFVFLLSSGCKYQLILVVAGAVLLLALIIFAVVRLALPRFASMQKRIDKVNLITNNIIERKEYNYSKSNPQFGFWGVPPNDLEILKLFPDNTHLYGWLRCVDAGTPADIDLEMYVNPDVPTVFYAQAFCAKCQLAKYLADKYNGLYIDIDDYATNSVRAKIEAFLKLR